MNEIIKTKLLNTLKSEAEYTLHSDDDIKDKIERMNDIFNVKKIIEHYEELEPLFKKYFREKAQKEKWNEIER